MSAPQPPAGEDPTDRSDPAATSDSGAGTGTPTYDFHGETLDFDPYRFGAPEPTAPAWSPPAPGADPTRPPAPGTDPARPPAPGERWSPGGGDPGTEVRPGDYWQGGGSPPQGGPVFPPPGYTPPANDPPSGDASGTRSSIHLDKAPPPPPGGYPAPSGSRPPGYPPPQGYAPPSHPGYSPAGGYPGAPQGAPRANGGNGLAIAGFVVSLAGCVLFWTYFIASIIGLVGIGLSIAGLRRARHGAPHRSLAAWGIGLGILAVVAGIAITVYIVTRVDINCLIDLDGDSRRVQECVR